MRRPWLCTVLLGLALLASPARAVTISLAGPVVPIQSGGTLSLAIVASDAGQIVSAFDLGITFNPAQFSFVQGSFAVGSVLGSANDLTVFSGTDAGTLLPFVISWLLDSELASLQTGNSLILATFDLRAIGSATEQTAAIGLTCNSVAGALDDESDDESLATLLEITACNGTTAVIQAAAVPEPGTLALLGCGLLALGGTRRIRPAPQQA